MLSHIFEASLEPIGITIVTAESIQIESFNIFLGHLDMEQSLLGRNILAS